MTHVEVIQSKREAPARISAYTPVIGPHMRFSRAVLVALTLASLLPTAAQDETKPYFSLSSGKTYGPGDKPAIQLRMASRESGVYCARKLLRTALRARVLS